VSIISCNLWRDTFYIGQTNCISIRNYNHLRDVTNFKKYLIGMNKCAAKHFHLKNHNYTKDLVCFISSSSSFCCNWCDPVSVVSAHYESRFAWLLLIQQSRPALKLLTVSSLPSFR